MYFEVLTWTSALNQNWCCFCCRYLTSFRICKICFVSVELYKDRGYPLRHCPAPFSLQLYRANIVLAQLSAKLCYWTTFFRRRASLVEGRSIQCKLLCGSFTMVGYCAQAANLCNRVSQGSVGELVCAPKCRHAHDTARVNKLSKTNSV